MQGLSFADVAAAMRGSQGHGVEGVPGRRRGGHYKTAAMLIA